MTAEDNIICNARNSCGILDDFLSCWKKNGGDEIEFRSCIHLRPTSSGVTVVSTMDVAPMRGKPTCLGCLKEILSMLSEIITGSDDDKLKGTSRNRHFLLH